MRQRDKPRGPLRHAEPGGGRGQRQQAAFGDQLLHQSRAAGAQSGAHHQFLAPLGEAREQQLSHVGAGDQQHQYHRPQQHQRGLPHGAGQSVAKRDQLGAVALRPLQAFGMQSAHFGLIHPAGLRQG